MFRRTFQAAVGLLLSASFVTAQTQNPAPAPAAAESGAQEAMEDLQVGDHWTYEVRDDVSGDIKSTLTNTVTDVSASQINIRLGKLGTGNTGYQTYDLMDNGAWHNRPNDGTGIQLPLAVGKSWSFRSTDLNNTAGSSWKAQAHRRWSRKKASRQQRARSILARSRPLFRFKTQKTQPGKSRRCCRPGTRLLPTIGSSAARSRGTRRAWSTKALSS
jgi:hypothetical protein